MNAPAPVHSKASRLPLRSKLVEWLEASPQKVANAQQWQGMINNLQSVRREEIGIGQDKLVADAPFAKEWHELALKAVIWLAIKQGFTHIGFTTGKQQCERWWNMEGMMNLYDQQIPKCLKKIASQFDCPNDWATIETRKPTGKIRLIPKEGWIVQDANKAPISPPVKNKDVALFYLNQRGIPVKEQVRVLQISPALKQAMMTGKIPLFGW